ncbi:MAG: AIR synthase related protein [Candidatus Thorarchaeota archaeon]
MLEKIAESIIRNKNIIEKRETNSVIKKIYSGSFKSERIYSDIGEDAASIKNSNENYILITTDRIKTDFIEKFPYGAGFSAILVGVDDIYACGGRPLAASIILSFKDKNKGDQIIKGLSQGSNKFHVPIIRGHTHLNNYYELSSTIVGEIESANYISAKKAQPNDVIILAVDFDGKIGKANKMYWDTTTFKSSELVLRKRKAMNRIAEMRLANSSKDISNSGIFGTIIQLASYSNMGARINVNDIEIPSFLIEANYSIIDYSQMFLTTSFILSAPKNNSNEIINIFKNNLMEARKIGEIIKEKALILQDNKSEIKVMNL